MSGATRSSPSSAGGLASVVQGGNLGAASTLTLTDTEKWLVGTLTANLTLTVAGLAAGRRAKLLLAQDATGGRTVTIYDGNTSQPVTVATQAGVTTELDIVSSDGTTVYIDPGGPQGLTGPAGPGGPAMPYGTLAARPTAVSAGDKAQYFATDDQGGRISQVQSGAWTPVAKGLSSLNPVAQALAADVGPITAQTVLQDATGLGLAIGASATEQWLVKWWLLVNAANTAMDAKFGFTAPTGAVMRWGAMVGFSQPNLAGWGATISTNIPLASLNSGSTLAVGTAAGVTLVALMAIVMGGGTAGTVQLQYAQNTSDAGNLKLDKGSVMEALKVAT